MKIEITKKTETKEVIDVEFPIYREHCIDGDGWSVSIYTKVNADLTFVNIKIEGSQMEIDIGKNYRFDGSDTDYILGRGYYSCSASEFDHVLYQAEGFFSSAMAIGKNKS